MLLTPEDAWLLPDVEVIADVAEAVALALVADILSLLAEDEEALSVLGDKLMEDEGEAGVDCCVSGEPGELAPA